MSITIVTSRAYLICDAINSITLRAEPERITNTKIMPYYFIDINFKPLNNGNQNNNNNRNNEEGEIVCIKVIGEKVALKLYKEVVGQIREQMPDQMYLDKMLENILDGSLDIHDDPSSATTDRPRRAKRRGKAVLRGVGAGRPRRKR